jgi:hypothetical protein
MLRGLWLYLAIDLNEGNARLVTRPVTRLVTRQVAMDAYDDRRKSFTSAIAVEIRYPDM